MANVYIEYSLIFLISVIAVFLIYNSLIPSIEKVIQSTNLDHAINEMNYLARAIEEVSKEAIGSYRKIRLEIKDGILYVDNSSNSLVYNYRVYSDLISKSLFQTFDKVKLSYGETKVYEDSNNVYLENDFLFVNISKNITNTSTSISIPFEITSKLTNEKTRNILTLNISLNVSYEVPSQNWLSGWQYRIPITITERSGNTLTDYQVLITLDTASLISQGKMRIDYGDIRFTDSDGITLLNYWIENPGFRINVSAFYGIGTTCVNDMNNFPNTPNSYGNNDWWTYDVWSCDDCDYYVRIYFNFAGDLRNAILEVVSDDDHAVWINGHYLGSAPSNNICHASGVAQRIWNIAQYIVQGQNEIRIWCSERGGDEYCFFRLFINDLEIRRNGEYSQNARIWVKVPNIPANSQKTIYVYYGNPSATSLSNGDNTFIFFDDFSGTSLNTSKWIIEYSDFQYSVSNGQLYINLLSTADGQATTLRANLPFTLDNTNVKNYIFEAYMRIKGQANSDTDWILSGMAIGRGCGGLSWDCNFIVGWEGVNDRIALHSWIGGMQSVALSISNDTWYIYQLYVLANNNAQAKVFNTNYNLIVSATATWDIGTGTYYLRVGGQGSYSEYWYDWVRVRKFASPEPSVIIGNEESSYLSNLSKLNNYFVYSFPYLSKTQFLFNFSNTIKKIDFILYPYSDSLIIDSDFKKDEIINYKINVSFFGNYSLNYSSTNLACFEKSSNTFSILSKNLKIPWLSNWQYRKPITIKENSGNALTDYQVLITNPIYNETGLVLSYHFNEGSGNIAYDSSGYNNHGNLVNGPTWVDGKFGKALSFDGVDDWIISSNKINWGTISQLTVSFWFYSRRHGASDGIHSTMVLVNCYETGSTCTTLTDSWTFEYWPNGYLEFAPWPGGNKKSVGGFVQTNTWYFVTGVLNGSTCKFYLNGIKVSERNDCSPLNAVTRYLTIATGPCPSGWGCEKGYFNGIIDEVRIYNRALSDEEIKALYEAKARLDYGDIRFTDSDGTTLLNYWQEADGKFWVKVPNIPENSQKTIYVYYGNPSATSLSNVSQTFIANSIYAMSGSCTDSTNCGYMDNHAEADNIRTYPANICTKYVDKIYWGSVCDNSGPGSAVRDYFYSRFRFLFVPDVSGTWYFAVDSDDGSELVKSDGDMYGGIHSHTIIATWYGVHGWCNCQNYYGSINLVAGQGIWFDYIQEEWGGAEAAVVWIRKQGGSWVVLSTTNFPNQIFARKYTSPEPSVTIGNEEGFNPNFINSIILETSSNKFVISQSIGSCEIIKSKEYQIKEYEFPITPLGNINIENLPQKISVRLEYSNPNIILISPERFPKGTYEIYIAKVGEINRKAIIYIGAKKPNI